MASKQSCEGSALADGDVAIVVTATMAEVYLGQGYTREALRIYRELSRRSPDNGRLRARIVEIEAQRAAEAVVARRQATIGRLERLLRRVRRRKRTTAAGA